LWISPLDGGAEKGKMFMTKKDTAGGSSFLYSMAVFITFVTLFCFNLAAAYAASKIDVNKTVFDFDQIDEGLPAIAHVHLKNIGDDDVIIEDIISS
jgi:hypothetical protein